MIDPVQRLALQSGLEVVGAGLYVLDERGEPRLEDDVLVWAAWHDQDERRIVRRQTFTLGDREFVTEPLTVAVSTVFMGIDHNFSGEGPPVLWETMIFSSNDEISGQERYTSRADAIVGHRFIVAELGGPVLD